MAEASQVRVVLCPKCENFLPEFPDFSLYKCGSCGAVLRAEKNRNLEDGLDEVRGTGQLDESSAVKVSRIIDLESIGRVERKLVGMENVDGIVNSGVERNRNKAMALHGSSTSQPKRMDDASPDYDKVRRGKERVRRGQPFDDESYPHDVMRNRNGGKNFEMNADRPEHVGFHGENVRESRVPREALRSRPDMDHWGMKSTARGVPAQVRLGGSLYHDEGQSSYGMSSNHKHGERIRYVDHGLDELARIESLENGRAELLRKLDELKDQITRSCDVVDKPNERPGLDPVALSPTLPDPYGRCNAAYVQAGLTGSQVPGKQPVASNGVPLYASHANAGFIPNAERHGLGLLDPYPQSDWVHPHDTLHRPDTNRLDMIRKPTHMRESHFGERPYHDPSPSYYGDVTRDLFMLHHHENFFHQPACSCVHCCEKNWHMPTQNNVDHPGLHNQRFQHGPSNPNFHHNRNPILHQPQGNSCGGSNLHPWHSQQPQTQHSNDLDSDNDGLEFRRPRKFGVPHRRRQVTYPISGGAPFMTCDNCFELLKLSRKHISLGKSQQKIKCGACSSIILFELGNKGFISLVSAHIDEVPPEIDEGVNDINAKSVSNNSEDLQQNLEKNSVSGGSERRLDPLSSTSSLYDEVESSESMTSEKGGSLTAEASLAEPDVPTEEGTDHAPENGAEIQVDEVVRSKRLEKERASFDITNTEENYVAASGTVTEISINGLSNSYVSQDSVDTNKDHSKGNKGGESFFAALIKRGFRDSTKSTRGAEVFVNGHLIPDRGVKKAEKFAGPIQPGNYWYDKQAGFWGVMGHPCLGIIMPNIAEFNYPIPKNCASGDTGVYVNGRELNNRDLRLLAKRGLPTTENRSYLIKITGEVVDEQTGERLDSLGKLAPTVLRAKHGFGMKVHRFLAQPKS